MLCCAVLQSAHAHPVLVSVAFDPRAGSLEPVISATTPSLCILPARAHAVCFCVGIAWPLANKAVAAPPCWWPCCSPAHWVPALYVTQALLAYKPRGRTSERSAVFPLLLTLLRATHQARLGFGEHAVMPAASWLAACVRLVCWTRMGSVGSLLSHFVHSCVHSCTNHYAATKDLGQGWGSACAWLAVCVGQALVGLMLPRRHQACLLCAVHKSSQDGR